MEFVGHQGVVEVVIFAPRASYAAIEAGAGITVRHTDCSERCLISDTGHFNIQDAEHDASEADGAYIATGGRDMLIKLWEA